MKYYMIKRLKNILSFKYNYVYTANVRKFLNASNTLMLESNENVINKFTEMILEKFENIDKTQLEQLAFY